MNSCPVTHLPGVEVFVPLVDHLIVNGVAGVLDGVSADGGQLPIPAEDCERETRTLNTSVTGSIPAHIDCKNDTARL